MKILSFSVFAFLLIFSPGLAYGAEQDLYMKNLQTLSQSYKQFVLHENDDLTHFLYDCALSSDPKKECIERIEDVKDITYKMLGEVESFNTIYKAIVYGSECLDNQLKIDMYSAIFHARNEYSMFQLDLDKICLSKKTESYLKERCEKELSFKKDFVKTTNSILDNMINHIDVNEK